MTKTSDTALGKSAWSRFAPPLAFVVALCLMVIVCYDWGYSGMPPTEKRYMTAKAAMENLKQDGKKNRQREPWEKLAAEFNSIYEADASWPNRPAVLFKNAETLEELAKRSYGRADARKAINCYEALALRHAASRLADDALFRAASMRASWLKDDKGALALLARLKKQYPNGDMLQQALALEQALKASARGEASPEAAAAVSRATASSADDLAPASQKNQGAGKNFAGDLPLRYQAAKSRITALKADSLRSCWRQPWENIRDEFLKISQHGKHRLAPAALYQAALCQQYLAACSRVSQDAKKAIDLYLSVASRFPAHAYADDALLNAAKLQRELANGQKASEETLERLLANFSRGDMALEARKLLASWRKSALALAQTKRAPELQVLSWDSANKNQVEIVLEMSGQANFSTRLVEGAKNAPAKVFLDFDSAIVVDDVRRGVTVQGSLLQGVRVKERPNAGASIQFDFRKVGHYETRKTSNPNRIILSVSAAKPAKAAASAKPAAKNADTVAKKGKLDVTRVSNMASQLGLTVHRVFIDAGHGGKDPGTSHNKIFERDITLDVAKRLGSLLQANGLEVIYSRTQDKFVRLSERGKLANRANADLFISIHVNANDNASVSGFETYFLDLASNQQAARVAMLENAASDRRLGDMQSMLADVMLNAKTDESKRLASDIQRTALFRLKKRNYNVRSNGVKSAPFHVLLGAHMPAILVEVGYCTNKEEAKNLASPQYRHALAEGLAEGVLAYRDRLLNNRTANRSLTGKKSGAM